MSETLFIPIPTGFFGNRYGVHSTRHPSAERIIFRITHADRLTIKRGAKLLDMTEAAFIRETTLIVAKALIKQAEEHNAHAHPSDGTG